MKTVFANHGEMVCHITVIYSYCNTQLSTGFANFSEEKEDSVSFRKHNVSLNWLESPNSYSCNDENCFHYISKEKYYTQTNHSLEF